MFRVYFHDRLRQHPHVGPLYDRMSGQPPWVIRTAVIAAVIVFAVPLIVLAAAAALAFILVAGLLSAAYTLGRAVRNLFSGNTFRGSGSSSGRVNVRVVPRDQPR